MVTLRGDILTSWVQDAACRGSEPSVHQDDWFGVVENAPISRAEVARSKSLCANFCPVRRECLKAALSGGEEWGTWGGFTAPERVRALATLKTLKAVMAAYDDGTLSQLVVRRGER
jgi:hypothetical protein